MIAVRLLCPRRTHNRCHLCKEINLLPEDLRQQVFCKKHRKNEKKTCTFLDTVVC